MKSQEMQFFVCDFFIQSFEDRPELLSAQSVEGGKNTFLLVLWQAGLIDEILGPEEIALV